MRLSLILWVVAAVALVARPGAAQQAVPFEGDQPLAPAGFEPQPIPSEPIEYDTAEVMRIRVVPVARGLVNPWSLAFLPDGSLLVTEREGRLRMVRNGVLDPKPIPGAPAVRTQGRSGLMDVVVHPQFATNQLVYFTYLKPGATERQSVLTVARGRFDGAAITGLTDIFSAGAGVGGPSRLAWGRDGKLYMTTPSGGNGSSSQDPNTYAGKVLRLNDDGTAPSDNPFAGRAGHKPEVYTFGHRNSLGLGAASHQRPDVAARDGSERRRRDQRLEARRQLRLAAREPGTHVPGPLAVTLVLRRTGSSRRWSTGCRRFPCRA